MAATFRQIHKGMSGTNMQVVQAYDASSIADDADWVLTAPATMRGEGWVPVGLSVCVPTVPAAAPGARVWLLTDSVGEAGVPVGVDLVSYTEATGVMVITNRTGAAVVGAVITVTFVAAPLVTAIP